MESKKLLSENSALREKFRREEMFDSIATTTLCTREAKALQLLVGGATRRRRRSDLEYTDSEKIDDILHVIGQT